LTFDFLNKIVIFANPDTDAYADTDTQGETYVYRMIT